MNTFMKTTAVLMLAVLVAGCGGEAFDNGSSKPHNTVFAVTIADGTGLAGFNYHVTVFNAKGDPAFDQTIYVPLHSGTNSGMLFADYYMMLPSGKGTVTVTPMAGEKTPSPNCSGSTRSFEVTSGKLIEIWMPVVCKNAARDGGINIPTCVNTAPDVYAVITDKFPCTGATTTFTVTTSDPEGNPVNVTYLVGTWVVTDPTTGAGYCNTSAAPGAYTLVTTSNPVQFTGAVAGGYCIQITATDVPPPNCLPGSTTWEFPIWVRDCGNSCCKTSAGTYLWNIPIEECRKYYGGVLVADSFCTCCKDSDTGMYSTVNLPPGLPPNPEDCISPDTLVDPVHCKEKEICCQLPGGSFIIDSQQYCISQGGTPAPDPSVCKVCCETTPGQFQAGYPFSQCGQANVRPDWMCCKPSTHMVVPSSQDSGLAVFDLDTLEPHTCPVNIITPGGYSKFTTCKNPSRVLLDANTDVITTCRAENWTPNTIMTVEQACDYCTLNPTNTNCVAAQALLAQYCTTCDNGNMTYPCDDICNIAPQLPNCSVIPIDAGMVVKHTKCGDKIWSIPLENCAATRGVVVSPGGRLFVACSHGNGSGDGRGIYEIDPVDPTLTPSHYMQYLHIEQSTYANFGLSVPYSSKLYGLATDKDGVYFCDVDNGYVGRIDIDNGPIHIEWVVNSGCYGIATDGLGRVWVSNTSTGAPSIIVPGQVYNLMVGVKGISTSNPTNVVYGFMGTVTVAPIDPASQLLDFGSHGVSVTPDHRVVTGNIADGDDVNWNLIETMYSANGVGVYDIASGTGSFIPLGPDGRHPRGVTVDSSSNIYSINRYANSVAKIDQAGTVTDYFGGVPGTPHNLTTSVLAKPYGYSGDMTGVSQCLNGSSSEPVFGPQTIQPPAVTWSGVSWSSVTPVRTSIWLYYQTYATTPDPDGWKLIKTIDSTTTGSSVAIPGPTAANIIFKAVLFAPQGVTAPSISGVTAY